VTDTLIFDLAGTTIDCGCRAPLGVFQAVFRERGVEVDEATARGPMGTHKREHIRQVAEAVREAWTEIHGAPPSPDDVDAMYARAEPLQIEVLPAFVEPVPGFVEMLSGLGGYRIGATTGYTAPMVEVLAPLIAARGWRPQVLVSASEVPAGRPAPYMNWKVAAALGAPAASSCVVVGDTAVDMQAARNAGMWAVGVALTGNEVGLSWDALQALPATARAELRTKAAGRLRLAGAQWVIDAVTDLPDLLARIGA
jgi:phosphonoacetaldehyde hydrolase